MKILPLTLLSALLCLSTFADAQRVMPRIIPIDAVEDNRWLAQFSRNLLDTMKIVYKASSFFVEIPEGDCFNDQPYLKEATSCVRHQLQSKDGEFIAFIQIHKIFTRHDSIEMKKSLPGITLPILSNQHIGNIKNNIRWLVGKEAANHWKEHVSYYPGEEAHQKFNADTAILVPIKLNERDHYKGKYNNFNALYLQKKGRGFVNFYFFYTDAAKKDLPLYIKEIEGILRYED